MSVPLTPALALQFGWSLIPTGRDKKPAFSLLPKNEKDKPTWKPYQTRQATPEEFSKWQRAKPAGWAIATSAFRGRITLDFDGEPGRVLMEKWGIRPHRRTGSGGF